MARRDLYLKFNSDLRNRRSDETMQVNNMAKSLRSKWKRKMRAIKRERYGKKELARLKKVLGIEENGDVEMKNIENIATVVDAQSIQADTEGVSEENIIQEENEGAGKESMDIDSVKQKYNRRTMRDEHGNYPEWMSQREVKKRAMGNRRSKQKRRRKHLRDKQKSKR